MFEHPRQLDHAAQLELAPAAARVRRMERLAEGARLPSEFNLGGRGELEVLRERPVMALALDLHPLELGVQALETLAERPDEPVERIRLSRVVARDARSDSHRQ